MRIQFATLFLCICIGFASAAPFKNYLEEPFKQSTIPLCFLLHAATTFYIAQKTDSSFAKNVVKVGALPLGAHLAQCLFTGERDSAIYKYLERFKFVENPCIQKKKKKTCTRAIDEKIYYAEYTLAALTYGYTIPYCAAWYACYHQKMGTLPALFIVGAGTYAHFCGLVAALHVDTCKKKVA